MTWVAAATVGASAIGAGASIYGSSQASKGGNGKNLPVAGYAQNNDPVLNASQILTLQALGMPVESLLNRASPIMQLQNSLSAPNAGTADKRRAQKTTQAVTFLGPLIGSLEAGTKTMEQVISDLNQWGYWHVLVQAAGLSGYGSVEDLINKELAFRKQMKVIADPALQQQIQAGRAGAQGEFANLQANIIPGLDAQIANYQLPPVTEQNILDASNAERQRMQERILQAANVGGFNPSAGLAEVQRDPNPIANAIALLTGKQALGINDLNALIGKNQSSATSLDALYKSIFGPIGTANETASIGLNAANAQASVAAQQASTIAGLQQNANNAKGTGTAAAGSDISSGLNTLAALLSYNATKDNQPGVKPYGGDTPLG